MSDFDPNNPSDSEGDDLGGLAWNEFDWEQYLREQDDVIHRYIGLYELVGEDAERLEKVARHMGWVLQGEAAADDNDDESDNDAEDGSQEPYTIHKNYIYVAMRAIFMKITREWEFIASKPACVPQPLAVAFLGALQRAEAHAVLAIHALDFGDFAMAVSLFKREYVEINRALAILDEKAAKYSEELAKYRVAALSMLFDLREISLRMMRDCRNAVDTPADDDTD